MTLLRCEKLTVRIGKKTVIEHFSEDFGAGSLTILVGPNGAGKTTLLRTLARVILPSAGNVFLDERPAERICRTTWARRVAYLPQSPDARSLAGFPVRAAVAAGRLPHTRFFGSLSHRDEKAIDHALAVTGLMPLASVDAGFLSGGETRRMFLAATLAQEAEILLLDEPFEGLDAEARAALADIIRGQLAEGHSVVLATHDLMPVKSIPHRTIELRTQAMPSPKMRGVVHIHNFMFPFTNHEFFYALWILAAVLLSAMVVTATTRGCPPELLWNYRVPRLLCAFCVGGILSVAGCIYQTLFRNPLASPYTLGTASGATLGAYLATILAPGLLSVGGAAFVGAMLSLALVRACGGSGARPARLLLGGIACAYLFGAGTMLCQFAMTPWESFSMAHWSLGSIVRPEGPWGIALPAAWGMALALALFSRPLDALLAGDDAAFSHGLNPARIRFAMLACAALLVSCAVAVCGPVGFVGLLVPHLVRLAVGATHGRLLPCCALGGGLFLALCDVIARMLPLAGTPPVGIVTAAFGAPALAFLLARSNR